EAVRTPVERKGSTGDACAVGLLGQDIVVLGGARGARDKPARKDEAFPLPREAPAGMVDERVLAGAARPDDADEEPAPERDAHAIAGFDLHGHATRRPSRHTCRTTGTAPVMCTHTRSARSPATSAPRSASPVARAGLRVTVATASGSEMAG